MTFLDLNITKIVVFVAYDPRMGPQARLPIDSSEKTDQAGFRDPLTLIFDHF